MTQLLPLSMSEARQRGWQDLDIVLVTGDAYVDHPSFGSSLIGRVLENAGYRVGIIAMPEKDNPEAMQIFGQPKLFFAVSSGNIDSMVANHTAFKKVRNDDPYAPGGEAGHRPDRALINYCNSVRRAYKGVPLVIGGIEASMRRIPHYDFWSNKVRRSILLDTRADILAYGMAEEQILEIARRYKNDRALTGIAGTVVMAKEIPEGAVLCPSEENSINVKDDFTELYRVFHNKQNKVLAIPSANRFIVHYPQAQLKDIDKYYDLPYTRQPHPSYKKEIPAFTMIRDSVTSHRGCVSGCSFCSLTLHQGKRIVSRSKKSILAEVKEISRQDYFKGHIRDIGGPSANNYDFGCSINWICNKSSCTSPDICKNLKMNSVAWLDLMDEAAKVDKVKHVTVGSGVRYDLLMRETHGALKLKRLLNNHVSGQLKIAPEHTGSQTTESMRKVPLYDLDAFAGIFKKMNNQLGKKQYLIPYLMSNHPGSDKGEMAKMKRDIKRIFGFVPDQVQSFIPLPMTLSAAIFYTGRDPLTGATYFVERDQHKRRQLHQILMES